MGRPGIFLGMLVLLGGAVAATSALGQQAPAAVDSIVGRAVAAFSDARAVGLDPGGTIYVADAGVDAIIQFAGDGSNRQVWGGPGFAAGTFDAPADVDPTNGLSVWVADEGNGRVQRFSRRSRFLAALPIPVDPMRATGPPRFATDQNDAGPIGDGRPTALVAAPDRSLYVLEATSGTVQVWSEQLQFRYALGSGVLAEARDLAWSQDRLLVLGRPAASAVEAARDGSVLLLFDNLGQARGHLTLPSQLQHEPALHLAADGVEVIVASERWIGRLDRGTATWDVVAWRGELITDVALRRGQLWILTARALWRVEPT